MQDALFITNFSDACFRATRAVAQLVDDVGARLVILHVRDTNEPLQVSEEKLHSFFPEADRFRGTRRWLAQGDLVDVVVDHRASHGGGFVIAPVPVRVGVPRPAHVSTRAALLERGVVVWTAGEKTAPSKIGAPVRNVACWLDSAGHERQPHLRRALDYADTVGARVHLLHPMPTLHEGTLTEPSVPLNADEVRKVVRAVACNREFEVHIPNGGGTAGIVDLVGACDADLLFISKSQGIRRGLFGVQMSGVVTCAPCPIICVSDEALTMRGG